MNDKNAHPTTNGIDLEFDRDHLWHPYTSMKAPLPVYPVVNADGVYIELETGERLIDGMSSWWSVIHGYNNPSINDAIQQQLSQMSHVMFGGLTHRPAVELAKKLVDMTPKGLDKVFLADSGSVSVEVALKMAIQYQLGKGYKNRNKFITLKHGYHGDTFGAMAVCDPKNSMHSLYDGMLPQNIFVDAPTSKPDQQFDPSDLEPLKQAIELQGSEIAALILEPIVQGAGGMRFYHSEFLAGAKAICDASGILLIADEIATGFGRTGKLFACEHANITPDIMCLGKALTGGYMTLAATLCTDKVAQGISDCDAGVLMHGPTFMGNPLACAAANASLALLQKGEWLQQVTQIEKLMKRELAKAADLNSVQEVRVLGAIGVIEMKKAVDVGEIQKAFVKNGIWVRPFGKLVYIMPQYIITEEQLQFLCTKLIQVLSEQKG
ncbi:adenosylmethionine--8-amino-7-oxononanoate transaminase [Psychrosphaera ytuae]|uniref:Adenosylmethionine-8-amino-7-oxononanoate aminotransferase n=1 Tax=Psychrosphaera ytuae TaxID=2820710 RepID=A0A975DCR8_9GAMM|nr:adenosylmethionine--8-amino-7-oxononanoate transaminase [Psychrosphaera ytuae]QTH64344.1 adenosylmethionine--8-amino-7-oxononanoate transaminase [Psychrosphaera ytuae]